MNKPTIRITIPVDGEIEIDVVGAQGSSCKSLTADIEKELGDVVEERRKPEYYVQSSRQGIKNQG